jgi:3-(3-hydroxy-phenyl)propionate hydroxylase
VSQRSPDADVIVVGAGPVGLTIANYLGLYGVSVLVLEARDRLIDYPRGVGMDDECLRAFQAIGVVDGVLPHTYPDQILRFVNGKGRPLLEVAPREEVFGWPRRNAFIQPLVDRVLLDGVDRFPHVTVRWGHTVERVRRYDDRVEVDVTTAGGPATFAASYLCGCDGGSSSVRKETGASFDGRSESTRWLVVDVQDDPLGYPNSYMMCDPRRPHVSIGLPHGIRRFEFMLTDDELRETPIRDDAVRAILARTIDHADEVSFAPPRTYIHHARLASGFRFGRVVLAGDSAHLMPVWQGQGYNSGIRDATNLSWKLAAVVRGLAGDDLLDSYEAERREHAGAMVDLSVRTGRIISPRNRAMAGARDLAAAAVNAVPAVRRYLMDGRFKPMPAYASSATLTGGQPYQDGAVGTLAPQPRVQVDGGALERLDQVLGPWFALVGWGSDPRAFLTGGAAAICERLGVTFVSVRPVTELSWVERPAAPGLRVVGDVTGELRGWFDRHRMSTVLVRPDRIVGLAALSKDLSRSICRYAARSGLAAPGSTARTAVPAPVREGE